MIVLSGDDDLMTKKRSYTVGLEFSSESASSVLDHFPAFSVDNDVSEYGASIFG